MNHHSLPATSTFRDHIIYKCPCNINKPLLRLAPPPLAEHSKNAYPNDPIYRTILAVAQPEVFASKSTSDHCKLTKKNPILRIEIAQEYCVFNVPPGWHGETVEAWLAFSYVTNSQSTSPFKDDEQHHQDTLPPAFFYSSEVPRYCIILMNLYKTLKCGHDAQQDIRVTAEDVR